MKRRAFVAGLGCALVMPPALAQARVRRIGFLAYDTREALAGASMIRAALKRLGYEEGKNLHIEERYAAGSMERLEQYARELPALGVELIVAVSNDEIAALKRTRASVPVVMYYGALPVELGFIRSRALPGENITGTEYHSYETAGKIVGLLKEAVPAARRIAVLWNPAFPGMRIYGAAADRAAVNAAMSIEYFDAMRPEEIPGALARVALYKPDALFVAYESVIGLRLDEIVTFARQRRLVSIGTSPVFAWRGGCLAYGPDLGDVAERTASYVDRILRGANPGTLPVEGPRKFELVVNLATARAIGYSPPPSLLARADRVINE